MLETYRLCDVLFKVDWREIEQKTSEAWWRREAGTGKIKVFSVYNVDMRDVIWQVMFG